MLAPPLGARRTLYGAPCAPIRLESMPVSAHYQGGRISSSRDERKIFPLLSQLVACSSRLLACTTILVLCLFPPVVQVIPNTEGHGMKQSIIAIIEDDSAIATMLG